MAREWQPPSKCFKNKKSSYLPTKICVTILDCLSWCTNTKMIVKQSQSLFQRGLKDFNQNSQILLHFYCCVTENFLTRSLTVWFGNLIVKEHKSLNRVVCLASKMTFVTLSALQTLYSCRLVSRALSIVRDYIRSTSGRRLSSASPGQTEILY